MTNLIQFESYRCVVCKTRLDAEVIAVTCERDDAQDNIREFAYRAKRVGKDRYVIEVFDRSGTLGYL